MIRNREWVAETFRALLPPEVVSVDEQDLQTYGRDWTKIDKPNPSVLVRPFSTAQVATILRICHEQKWPVVPSGGRTGLAGGAIAACGEVVLSLERMRKLHPVDLVGGTVRVQSGVITAEVHRHCESVGLTWPVDFASKGSSQVGGNISTNAGGVKVIRYGLTRQWVLGLQVVLPGGTVLELNGALEKNNTGIDLRQLFIGSEGMLGVITEATLKLCRTPGKTDVLLFAVSNLSSVLRLFRAAKQGPFTLMAFEFFTDRCLARLKAHRKVREPFSQPASHYVLLETEHAHDLEQWLSSLFDDGLVLDGVMAQHGGEAAALWELREGISESLSATGFPHKNDIALPIDALESFCAAFQDVFERQYPGWEICLFGHIGDGNLHVNVMKPDSMSKEEFLLRTKEADQHMFALVKAHHGSISAEHGIGLLKKKSLHFTRTETEIQLFRAMKQVFDPHGILNPGKVID